MQKMISVVSCEGVRLVELGREFWEKKKCSEVKQYEAWNENHE